MHATLRQLRLFLALADLGSMAAVARELHVSQPTVSIQLGQLADSIGLPLYEQVGKRLFLTEAGRELAQTCREMFAGWDRFEMVVNELKGLKKGSLRLAVVSTAQYFVPRLLGPFCARYPEIDVHLEVENRDRIVQRLAQNLDDLTIMAIPPDEMALQREEFLKNPLVVVAPLDFPSDGAAPWPVTMLADQRFILREPGSGTRIATERFLAARGVNLQVRMALGSNEAIKQAIAGGLGVSVLSRHAMAADPASEGLRILPVEGFPIDARWYLVYPAGKRLSVVAQTFDDYLKTPEAQALLRARG